MKKSLSKKEAEKKVSEFFKDFKNRTPKEFKKINKFSMTYKIPLKERRKLFCKKCYHPYINSKIRIKKGKKIIVCENCGKISRWRIK